MVFDLARMEGDDGPHFVELFLFELAALGLHFAELLQSLQQAAGQALFVDGECRDRVFGAAEGVGEGEGGVRFGVAGVPVVSVFFVTDGEEVVLGGGHAVEAELEVGAGVGELDFDGADGIECGGVIGGEFVVGGHVFFGKEDDLGEDAVAGGVQARSAVCLRACAGRWIFWRFRDWLGGVLRRWGALAFGVVRGFGWHVVCVCVCYVRVRTVVVSSVFSLVVSSRSSELLFWDI